LTILTVILQHFKLFTLSIFILVFLSLTNQAWANEQILIQVFSREGCIHCQAEKEFFEELGTSRSDFTVEYLDLSEEENTELWTDVTSQKKLPKVTPITLVGQSLIQGFATSDTTGATIVELIDYYKKNPSQITTFEELLQTETSDKDITISDAVCLDECVIESETNLKNIHVPFLGAVNLTSLSLPALAATLGFIDGFNPCAMWVLVTFLLILAQLKSRRKMLVYAGLFIIAEAVMYTLILTVWYTTWDFVGLDKIVTPLVGLVGLLGGVFFLYEWKTAKPGECKVTDLNQRQKIRQRIQNVVEKPLTLMSALTIILIAFSVNVIEFACSIGIPQTFTKILEINSLNLLSTASLIGLYILMYMVDDFIVFGIALYSFEKIGLTSKYSKLSNLLGGILLIILGLILIINPGLLRIF